MPAVKERVGILSRGVRRLAPDPRRSLKWVGAGLVSLCALLAAVTAGFDRDVLFDLEPYGYDASVQLFMDGARDVEVDPGEPGAAIPYILPGPLDPWAGSTEHTLRLRLGALSRPAVLRLHAVETHDVMPPHLALRLNQTVIGGVETRPGTGKPPPHQTRGVRSQYALRLAAGTVGPSVLAITNDGGSWVMWERLQLREAHSAFAWSHFGIAGRPPQVVLGFLAASVGAALLGGFIAGTGGHWRWVRLATAACALVLIAGAWARVVPGDPVFTSLPRWAWLLAPWIILAASPGILGRAARAAGRWARSCAWPPRGWPWLRQRPADPRRPRSRRRALALAGVAFLLALFVQALFVKAFAVDIPYWDEWEHLRMLLAYRSGTLGWPQLFAQHNEHRVLFPRLLLLAAFDLLGEWSPRASMLQSAALAAGIAFVWSYVLQRLGVRTWVALVSTAILVSPLQWENITYGFQTSIYLSVLASVLAVCFVALAPRPGWGTLVAAMVGCGVASFSFTAGLASWISVALCLGLRILLDGARPPITRRRWTDWSKAGVFCFAGGLSAAAFFHGFDSNRVAPTQLNAAAARWMLTALGFPFVEAPGTPMIALLAVGLLQWTPIVGLGVLYVRRREEDPTRGKLCMLVGMASLVLVSAGAMSLGRSTVPFISPRYGTILLWTSLVGLLAVAELLAAVRRLALNRRARAAATVTLWLVGASLLSPYWFRHDTALGWLRSDAGHREQILQAMIRYLDPASPARRLGDPLAHPVRDALENWLSDPARLAALPMEIRLAHSSSWRLTETGPRGGAPGGPWGHRARVESPSILVDRPVLAVPVAGYPSAPGNWLAIEPASNPLARIFYRGPNPGASWTMWWVDTAALLGQEIRLAGAVGNGDGEDWLEFRAPGQTGRLMGLLRDFPSTLELVAGAVTIGVLGLAFTRGRRFRRRHGFPLHRRVGARPGV